MIRFVLTLSLTLGLSLPLLAAKEWQLKGEDNKFAAGEPAESFEYFTTTSVDQGDMHHQINWATAAAVQMLLNEQDLYVDQETILRHIYGKKEDQPVSVSQVRSKLNSLKSEKGVKIKASKHNIKELKIADDLAKYGPLMVGVEDTDVMREGIPLVLLQVEYEFDYFKKKIPKKVILLDPWPMGRDRRHEMTWYDFINHLEWATRLEVKGR